MVVACADPRRNRREEGRAPQTSIRWGVAFTFYCTFSRWAAFRKPIRKGVGSSPTAATATGTTAVACAAIGQTFWRETSIGHEFGRLWVWAKSLTYAKSRHLRPPRNPPLHDLMLVDAGVTRFFCGAFGRLPERERGREREKTRQRASARDAERH